MVRPHSRALVSPGLPACLPYLPTCVPVADDAPAFPRSCPALSPCVGCCLRVPPVLPPFVSLLISLSWMVCRSLVSLLIFLCWMVCLPSRGLVLPCPPLFPIVFPHVCPTCVPVLCDRIPEVLSPLVSFFLHMCACVGWCVRLPKVLPPLVSHSLPFCVPVFGWYGPLSPTVLPTYVPAMDFRGLASACLSLSPHKCACPGWCVRFLEVLSRMVFLLVSLCWMVCPLSRLVSPCFLCLPLPPIVCHCLPTCESAFPRSCLPLCPFLFPFVGWCVCRPLAVDYLPLSPYLFPFVGWCAFPRTCPPCPPACLPACQVVFPSCSLWCPPSSLFPFLFPFLGWCARLPEALSPSLSPSWSLFLFPFVGWCVRLPPCLPRLPSFFPFVGWFVRLPKSLSRLSPSSCFRSCFPLLEGASTFLRSCLFCLPACLPACFPACPPACLPLVPQQKFSHAENCADLKVHRAPGLKMMCHLSLSSFDVFNTSNLTVLCCCFERLEPNTCTPIGCFLRRFSASSVATKQAKPNKINVYKVVCGTFCRYVH